MKRKHVRRKPGKKIFPAAPGESFLCMPRSFPTLPPHLPIILIKPWFFYIRLKLRLIIRYYLCLKGNQINKIKIKKKYDQELMVLNKDDHNVVHICSGGTGFEQCTRCLQRVV